MRRLSIRNVSGFTLIEVLVALFIVSFGLLGVAALFVQMYKFNGSAMYRTRAVMHAADMADRIRANPTAQAGFANTAADTGTNNGCHATDTDSDPTSCAVAALAAHEVFLWKQNLTSATSGLPAGTGEVTFTAGATASDPDVYQITVTWLDVNDPAGAATESHILTLEL